MAYLAYLAENHIRLKDRIALLLNFKILRMKPFDDREKRTSVTYALQLLYYDKALQDNKSTLAAYRNEFERCNLKVLLGNLHASSMGYLKHHLHQPLSTQETL